MVWLIDAIANAVLAAPGTPESVTWVPERPAPGAKTMAYISLPGASAFTRLAHSSFGHEFGHFLNRGQVIGRAVTSESDTVAIDQN